MLTEPAASMPIPGHIDPVPVPRPAADARRSDGRVDLVGLTRDQPRAFTTLSG